MRVCAFYLLKSQRIGSESAGDAEGGLANLSKSLSILWTLPPNLLGSNSVLFLISG